MLIVTHPAFGRHETPAGHVEQRARYTVVERALAGERFADASTLDAPVVDVSDVAAVHGDTHIAAVRTAGAEAVKRGGMLELDPDTWIGPSSLDAALRAAGGAVAAVDAVCEGRARSAFVAARPPGHHATPDQQMGFCIFNNAAIAAMHARKLGHQRVAVVDFDVHHGNGTQDIFWNDPEAFFASSHEWPQWPGTGDAHERGATENVVNAPIPTGGDGEAFRRAWGETILPALDAFAPDFIVISAGFDAHAADPLGGLNLVEEDFAWATREIAGVAASRAGGRVVSVLEGGYDLAALGSSVAAHVAALMES